MSLNPIALLVAALVSLPIGFVWYNPKVFGNAWMKAIGKTQEDLNKNSPNMILIFGLSLLFAFMIAMMLNVVVIHQNGLASVFQSPDLKGKSVQILIDGNVSDISNYFRTFGHGAFHGVLVSIFLALPIIAQSAVYERKSFKYIAISVGYWVVTLAIMGGIICMWK